MGATDISVIHPGDRAAQRQLDSLLSGAGIRRDANLDYTVGLFDDEGTLLATGSAFANTLRCLAVSERHRGEGYLNQIVTFLIEEQTRRGFGEVFLYTKPESARFFADLGFDEIERVPGYLVFMSNRPKAFTAYLNRLKRNALVPGRACAVVMNANPFTLGHLHLLEMASRQSDVVHVFVVSEDASLFSFKDRFDLVRKGSAHLYKVMCHPTGSYMVSNATFPSYFIKQADDVTRVHALLDTLVFARIASTLGITRRFVGEEPFSGITRIYNQVMAEELPKHGIDLEVIPRCEHGKTPVSASNVRQLIHDGHLDQVRPLVPRPTYEFLTSDEAGPTIDRICRSEHVRHD